MTETNSVLTTYESGREFHRLGNRDVNQLNQILEPMQLEDKRDFLEGYFDEDLDYFLHTIKSVMKQLNPIERVSARDIMLFAFTEYIKLLAGGQGNV